jgi:probable aminopeptidase NPEPL1
MLSDSEGRFVIGDGCSWLARRHGCRILVDAATLTGHSAFTGRVHAAILSNDTAMEMVGLTSSFATGELVHPMIFAPEQAKNMLHSTIADMTNDPSDGEGYMYSAMSGYFVYAQVEDIPDVRWEFRCLSSF